MPSAPRPRLLVPALLALAALACAPHAAGDAPAPSSPPVRYLALGDSFTIGTGGPPDRAFPARFVARAPCPVALRNVAVNGYSTEDLIEDELPSLEAFAPSVVSVAIGANDIVRGASAAEYRANVQRILGAIQHAGVRHVFAIPQPDWSRSPAAQGFGDPAALHARIVEANGLLRDEVTRAGGVYVDLFSLMEDQAGKRMLAPDGLHPSGAAYDAWAAELERRAPSLCAR